jgi:hypothetical protein
MLPIELKNDIPDLEEVKAITPPPNRVEEPKIIQNIPLQAPVEIPKPKETHNVSLSGLSSLKNTIKEQLANQVSKEKIQPTQENIKPLWLELVDIMFAKKVISKNMLFESEFVFTENHIEVLANLSVYDYLTAERLTLLDWFKRKYHNEAINVIINEKVISEKDSDNTILSTREIFELMADRNPALRLLKDKLLLDFEM